MVRLLTLLAILRLIDSTTDDAGYTRGSRFDITGLYSGVTCWACHEGGRAAASAGAESVVAKQNALFGVVLL